MQYLTDGETTKQKAVQLKIYYDVERIAEASNIESNFNAESPLLLDPCNSRECNPDAKKKKKQLNACLIEKPLSIPKGQVTCLRKLNHRN